MRRAAFQAGPLDINRCYVAFPPSLPTPAPAAISRGLSRLARCAGRSAPLGIFTPVKSPPPSTAARDSHRGSLRTPLRQTRFPRRRREPPCSRVLSRLRLPSLPVLLSRPMPLLPSAAPAPQSGRFGRVFPTHMSAPAGARVRARVQKRCPKRPASPSVSPATSSGHPWVPIRIRVHPSPSAVPPLRSPYPPWFPTAGHCSYCTWTYNSQGNVVFFQDVLSPDAVDAVDAVASEPSFRYLLPHTGTAV